MAQAAPSTTPSVDFDKFRLRGFVDRLIEMGQVDIHDAPVALADLSRIIEASPRASLFRKAGPEAVELVASAAGSRVRLAAAFGVDEDALVHEYMRRLGQPQQSVEVSTAEAPVHQVVLTGDKADLARLPFHVQHEFDGGTYISSGIDFAVDPETGKRNTGCRRLMLRGRQEMGSNLTNESDLKAMYLRAIARKERLPVNFVVGSHPLDMLAATMRGPEDEFALLGTLRGEPVPLVKAVSNDIMVPADAELVIEGYFDEKGYTELEGPYGEFYGFYGPVHIDPVFHVTAITHRSDVLHQSVLHSGWPLSWTETTTMLTLIGESIAWRALRGAHLEPAAVSAVPASNGMQHIRVAIDQRRPGTARLVMSALFAVPMVKHVFVVDPDVDVRSDEMMEWAMSTRFRAERDIVVAEGFPPQYMDPANAENETMTKAGFDLTRPYGQKESITGLIPRAPRLDGPARFQTVRQALESGPMFFAELMEAVGSKDGREVTLELDALRQEGKLTRREEGEWALKG